MESNLLLSGSASPTSLCLASLTQITQMFSSLTPTAKKRSDLIIYGATGNEIARMGLKSRSRDRPFFTFLGWQSPNLSLSATYSWLTTHGYCSNILNESRSKVLLAEKSHLNWQRIRHRKRHSLGPLQAEVHLD